MTSSIHASVEQRGRPAVEKDIQLQSANLDEHATLFTTAGETEHAVAAATVGQLAAMALAWDDERFPGARIVTDAGMRLTPNQIISLGRMMGIERGKDLP